MYVHGSSLQEKLNYSDLCNTSSLVCVCLFRNFIPKKVVNSHSYFDVSIPRFVSCLTFVSSQDYPEGLLVSGSGDSTVSLSRSSESSLSLIDKYCIFLEITY